MGKIREMTAQGGVALFLLLVLLVRNLLLQRFGFRHGEFVTSLGYIMPIKSDSDGCQERLTGGKLEPEKRESCGFC